jgi:hypothetical protein
MKLGFEERVLRPDGFYHLLLNGKKVGFNLDLRINYYRGMQLSTVETLKVTVDGMEIPSGLMMAQLNGKCFGTDELKQMYQEYWGIKDPMHLRIFNGGLPDGEHEVSVKLIFKSPYMKFTEGVYGLVDGSCSKRLTIAEGREFA